MEIEGILSFPVEKMLKRKTTLIARKLTRMNMLVTAIALFLACAGFVAYDLANFRQAVVRNLLIQTELAAASSVSALTSGDNSVAEQTLAVFGAAPNILSVRIYTVQGEPFASYRRNEKIAIPDRPNISPGEQVNYWFEGETVSLVHAIAFEGKTVGYIYIQSSSQSLKERVRNYAGITAVVLVISLLAALFVSRIARRSIAEPLVNLANVARTVSQDKNYSIRATMGKEEGELAVLVDTFNQMLASLQHAHDELELRVEQRTAELAAAMKEIESFSYSVSHDLRAPLRTIDGFSQALEEDYGDQLDSNAKNYLQRTRAAAQRMGILIDDLLNLSRVTRVEMRREQVDLSSMAHSIAAELQKEDIQRRVDWVIGKNIRTVGDSRLLRVVLDNLLGNAWKYTSKHSTARIEFGEGPENGSRTYFVKDDGAGFDPAYAQRLFGAFQRLHGVDEFPGTGIGLATVQRIVLRHGGHVWAEGSVEHGATFYFSLEQKNQKPIGLEADLSAVLQT
jgi:signal transduction histidine kinase